MTLDVGRIRTFTFDSYSTLVDPRSAGRVLDAHVAEPESVAVEWHARAVRYATVSNHLDRYRSYYDLHRAALEDVLAARGVDLPPPELDEMTAVYHDLEPFDDVRRGMERLSAAGYDLAVLSNGNPDLLASLLRATDTEDLVETTVSAAEIRRFKPASELYEHAADRLDTPVERVAHVGAGWADVMGCTNAGMQGVWLARGADPWPTFDGEPDLVVDSMDELVAHVVDRD